MTDLNRNYDASEIISIDKSSIKNNNSNHNNY